jgi:hypothetical protein
MQIVMSIRLSCQLILVTQLSLIACAVSAATCEEKELWFEAGIGFYSNGYSLEGTEKRTRSLYRKMKGEPLTEDEAVATALEAWRFLDEQDVSINIAQVQRLVLADQYYARCREQATTGRQGPSKRD